MTTSPTMMTSPTMTTSPTTTASPTMVEGDVMLRLVSSGGVRTPHPPIARTKMQHVQDTLKHAANDANEAIHCNVLGWYSLCNAWAMGTRAMANGVIATVENMTEQSRQAWEQAQ